MPSRGLSRTETLDVAGDVYLGVSVSAGGLEARSSDHPFYYL